MTDQPNSSLPKSHHRQKKSGTETFIRHDILKHPKLFSLATCMKMTPTQQVAFTETLIQESGGDVSKVATSYSTTDK